MWSRRAEKVERVDVWKRVVGMEGWRKEWREEGGVFDLASSSILCVTPRRNFTISVWLDRGAWREEGGGGGGGGCGGETEEQMGGGGGEWSWEVVWSGKVLSVTCRMSRMV